MTQMRYQVTIAAHGTEEVIANVSNYATARAMIVGMKRICTYGVVTIQDTQDPRHTYTHEFTEEDFDRLNA